MASDVTPAGMPCGRADTEITSASEHNAEINSASEHHREITSTNKQYDVFISHRGPDTKTGFVSYLYKDLEAAGLQPFLDCRSIDMGEDSWESIENAIKKTPIAVVVFSESFTASEWCLRELDVMLGTPGIKVKVLPVFYNVRPGEVRFPVSGSGQFREGFEKLRRRHDDSVIERWRGRLEEASKIMGWEHPGVHKLEVDLVQAVVGEIVALANKPLPLAVEAFGVKQVAEEIMRTLEKKKEVLMLGLWGMGGIGKSTLARELYNQLSRRYDAACYVEDVTEKVTRGGVMEVQQHIMMDLCKNNPEDIKNKSQGKTILEERLCKKRFLLVLDDVCDNDAMEYCITSKMLREGSKCIITSRNRGVFEKTISFDVEHVVHIHNVQGLSDMDSERVLMANAFGGHGRKKAGFDELVSSISKGCGGVPLVLKVCGALLRTNSNVDVWKEVMAKLDQGTIMDEEKIFKCLRISYDALPVEQQEMFLDIACALIGERKDLAMRVWKGSPKLGICSLVEKALITVDEKGRLRMHDHLKDMGQEIVRQRRASDGIKRRLWMPESLRLLVEEKRLPDTLETLQLSYHNDMHIVRGLMLYVDVSPMRDLRILLCTDKSDKKSLRGMTWIGPYLGMGTRAFMIVPSLPKRVHWYRNSIEDYDFGNHFSWLWDKSNFPSVGQNNDLVVLEMVNLRLYRLPKALGNLSNLEVMDLSGCSNLIMLPNSFGRLKKLRELKLFKSGIGSLPMSFGELSNLEVLDLSGCSNLTMLPDSFGSLKKLRELNLDRSGIEGLPRSFEELSSLEVLDLSNCSKLTILPNSFGGLKKLQELKLFESRIGSLPRSFGELSNLEVLGLSGCRKLTMLPDLFGSLKKLRELNLNWSGIESLPSSFRELSNLEVLGLSSCSKLTMLPDSFESPKKLRKLILDWSGIESLPSSFGELSNLEVLNLSGCSNLTMLPDSFGSFKELRELNLDWSGIESLPRSFGELSNLEVLSLSGCSKLTMLPDSFGSLKKLRELNLDWSGIESLPRSFGELSNLKVLNLKGCRNFPMLPDSFGSLKKLRKLILDWSGIESLPRSFGELSNLEVLNLRGCRNFTMLPDSFGSLKKLQELNLDWSGIESLPRSFGELSSLEVFDLERCSSLTLLTD